MTDGQAREEPQEPPGRRLAVILSDDDLHNALRERAEKLKFTRRSISLAANLTESHGERALAPGKGKPLGPISKYSLIGALEAELWLVTAKPRRRPGKVQKRKYAVSKRAVRFARTVSLRFLRQIGRKGGKARVAKMTPRQRSRIARQLGKQRMAKLTPTQRKESASKAAAARWHKTNGVSRAAGTSAAAGQPSGSQPDRRTRSDATSEATRRAPTPQRRASARVASKPR